MPNCLIGLGANLGSRRETLRRAVELLAGQRQVRLLQVSRWYETRPAGGPADGPSYLNGAATLETTLVPHALLAVLQDVEHRLGRRRRRRWEPRAIDLDLLLYEDRVECSSSLVVPHPRMAWRRFVIEPASQIAPSMVHPVIGWSIARLWGHLKTTPPYVAVTGILGSANTAFARRVAGACSADGLFDTMSFDPGMGCRRRLASADAVALARRRRHPAARFQVDPSGQQLRIALECLRRRARLLAAHGPRWLPPQRTTVSDFWFDESRALGPGRLSAPRQSLFFRLWRRLERRVVRPRLVVLLDVPNRQRDRQTRRSGSPAAARKLSRRALDRQLRRADVGPVLRLADPDSSKSLDEVVAAIRAMA